MLRGGGGEGEGKGQWSDEGNGEDNEGKKMNTGIMKSRSSKQLRSKNQ